MRVYGLHIVQFDPECFVIVPYPHVEAYEFLVNVIYDGLSRFKIKEQRPTAKERLDISSPETWNVPHYIGNLLGLATPVFYHWFHCLARIFVIQSYDFFEKSDL